MLRSRFNALRAALREVAARRRIREEVRRLAEDTEDREEMRLIREQMARLAPERLD